MDESPKVVFNALDWNADIDVSHRNLPHWLQIGAAMFITFRTADSLPREVLLRRQRELEQWLTQKDFPVELAHSVFESRRVDYEQILESLPPDDRQEFRKQTDRLFQRSLDECHGACLLKRLELGRIVAEAMLHYDGSKYDLDCFVVMPNHVHAIVQFRTDSGLSIVGQSWMRYSARLINRQTRETGPFWQAEAFDHVIRSTEQFSNLRRYIAGNPAKANLHTNEYLFWARQTEVDDCPQRK